MRSQLRFAMHPDDEMAFVSYLLSDNSVLLIDGPRWKTPSPRAVRSLDEITGDYCIIWSPVDMPTLSARFIPTCDDWYCDSEEYTIQFLRSSVKSSVLLEGRIAISTGSEEMRQGEVSALGVERRFNKLRNFMKKTFRNSVIRWCNPKAPFGPAQLSRSANPSKPEAQLWVGPCALAWLRDDPDRRVKQFPAGIIEGVLVDECSA